MRVLKLALVLAVLGTAGCVFSEESEGSLVTACERICDCSFFSPTAADLCTDDCIAESDFGSLPDACVDCFSATSCPLIEAGACDSSCFGSDPDPQPVPNQ